MRSWLSLFLLAPALFAQSQIPDAAQTSPSPDHHNYWHYQPPPAKDFFVGNPVPAPVVVPPGNITVAPVKPLKVQKRSSACSVPLINVFRNRLGAKYHMRKVPAGPAAQEHFVMRGVTPPAPPCDDGK